MKAMDPSGEWQQIYANDVLARQTQMTNGIGLLHVMNEVICRPTFLVDTLRIELDTQGIEDWNYISSIKLIGSLKPPQPSALIYSTTRNQVRYLPRPDKNGNDTFQVQAFDCSGNLLRGSDSVTVNLFIEKVDDRPLLSLYEHNDG